MLDGKRKPISTKLGKSSWYAKDQLFSGGRFLFLSNTLKKLCSQEKAVDSTTKQKTFF
jgi:hypothetical protein